MSQVTTPEGLELVYGYDTVGRVATISPNSTLTDWFTGNDGAGADPAKWTRQAVGGGTAAIDGQRLRLSTTGTAGSSMGVTSTAAQAANTTASVSFQAASNTAANQSRVTVGVRQNAANTQGYRVEVLTDQATAKLIKRVAGVDTVLGTMALPAAGTDTRVQIEAAGTTVRAKAWASSAAQPAAWGVSVTDTAVTAAGSVRVRTDRVLGSNSVAVDNFRQRNNPTVALAPYVTNTYNADSQVTNEALVGGSRAYTYTKGRLTKVVQTVPGANRTTAVTYDTAGAIKTTAVAGVTTTYGYDAASQLTSATPSTGTPTTYGYDNAGRRTSQTKAGVTTSYTYNSASQLLAATPSTGAATSFTYDLAGRRLTATTGTAVTTNTYDQAGRLITVTKATGATVAASEARRYTPDGLLRESTVTGAAGTFLRYLKFDWDRNRGGVPQVVSTLEGETNYGVVRNPATGETLAASTKGNTPTLFGVDVFGSVLNSTGQALADATGWDAYGVAVGATAGNTKATFGYRGELTNLGDVNLRARSYDPTTGSFTTVDPLDDVAGTPTSGNRYHYTNNDPINRIDPTGLRPDDGSISCVNPYDGDDSVWGFVKRNTLGRAETGSCQLISHPRVRAFGDSVSDSLASGIWGTNGLLGGSMYQMHDAVGRRNWIDAANVVNPFYHAINGFQGMWRSARDGDGWGVLLNGTLGVLSWYGGAKGFQRLRNRYAPAPVDEPLPATNSADDLVESAMAGRRLGHTLTKHGAGNTEQLLREAGGSGRPLGQFLDDAAAERFIADHLDELGQGARTFPAPEGLGRMVNPDGSFSPATRVRLVPSGSGVKTAYPEP